MTRHRPRSFPPRPAPEALRDPEWRGRGALRRKTVDEWLDERAQLHLEALAAEGMRGYQAGATGGDDDA